LVRSPTAVAWALCAVYVVAVLVGSPHFGPETTPWFLAGLSAAFVWGYRRLARGHPITALSVVAALTVLFPIMALVALVWPLYRSPVTLLASLGTELLARGAVGALQLFAPLIAAGVVLFFVDAGRPDATPGIHPPSKAR
jgi:hypothetical protein